MPHGSCPMHRHPSPLLPEKALTYAVTSIPPACKLRASNVGKGYGVFTNQNIPLGTWIGPYEGTRIRPSDVTRNMDTSHMWEVTYTLITFMPTTILKILINFVHLRWKEKTYSLRVQTWRECERNKKSKTRIHKHDSVFTRFSNWRSKAPFLFKLIAPKLDNQSKNRHIYHFEANTV